VFICSLIILLPHSQGKGVWGLDYIRSVQANSVGRRAPRGPQHSALGPTQGGQCCGAGPGDAEQGGEAAEAVTRQGGQDQEGQSPGQADCSATETERRKDRLPARPSPSRVAHSATSPACQACSRLPKLLHAWPWPLAAMGGVAPGASQGPGEGGPAGRRGGRAPGTSQRPLTEEGLFFSKPEGQQKKGFQRRTQR